MKAYCHTRKFSLRHTDFDFKDELRLSAILSLAQEAAGSSADELGFGYKALREKGMGFIIVNSYCEIEQIVRPEEEITVETWPLPPRHGIFERAYRMSVNGGLAANLITRWCLVDLETFSLLGADSLGDAHEKCPYRSETVTAARGGKIQKIAGRAVYTMRVGVSRCDRYLHVNNARYADFFLDCFTMEELSRRIKSFQIAYLKQAKAGQELSFYREDCGGESVCEAKSGEETVAQFRVTFA